MVKKFDFYTGFENEPSIKFLRKEKNGNVKSIINMWIGFFDSILNLIEPNSEGYWEGIALLYHEELGWYEEPSWKCDCVKLFISQLTSIDKSKLPLKDKEILEIMVVELEKSILLKECIYIEME